MKKDANGKPLIVAGLVLNITERKHTEEKIREKDIQFRKLSANVSDLIFQFTRRPDGTYYVPIATEGIKNIFGCSPEDVLEDFTPIGRVIYPEDAERVISDIEYSAKHLTFFTCEFRVQIPGKPIQWIYSRSTPEILPDGSITWYGFNADITERKLAESVLQESEKKLKKAQHFASMGSWTWNIKTNQLDWSDEMFHIFGLEKETFSGVLQDVITKAIHPEDRSKVDESNLSVIKDKKPIPLEYRIIWPDQSIHTVWAEAGEVLFDENNNPSFISGTVQDITERKNSEQALRNAQKLESIGTLAGGIAHDFNNLLNAIMGQSSLALKKLSEENPAVSNITKAIKASERAADLTKQLLAYSGRGKCLMERIDLNLLVRENIGILEVSVSKNAELRYELSTPSPCIIADSGQIQQVIMNLIINASDAMGTNPGVITIRTNSIELSHDDSKYSEYTHNPLTPGSYVLLQVSDTGSGISRETLTRIFDPFFTTKFTGRGLGLSAVLGIIKGHKGGLRIESEVGRGTMFEVVLPLINTSQVSNVLEKKKSLVLEGEGKTILIIDDDPFVFQLLEDIFTEYHFTVIGSSDPIHGIEYYRREYQNISMVVLDYSMPHMNGKDAFEKLIQINKNVKVLLCSGYTEEETLLTFEKDRPAGFLQKPHKSEALVQRVAEIVSKES